jgi:hypothetical protein
MPRANRPALTMVALPMPFEDEPMFGYRVPEVDVVVTYYVLVYERLMLVKEIDDA